jgi:mannose-6-phosphate isomerase-like protein (cupin superfamily)
VFEEIRHQGALVAIIVKSDFDKPGIHFFTPDDFSQQLAYMRHPAGHVIGAHYHNPVPREVVYTQEVLVIRRGRLRVDFYDRERLHFASRELGAGDVILLASGGHGFKVLEDLEMLEIKQGPYCGEQDKTRFDGEPTLALLTLGKDA